MSSIVSKERCWAKALAPLLVVGWLGTSDVAGEERRGTRGPSRVGPALGAPSSAEPGDGRAKTIRLFKLAHRDPGDAFTVVQPLLSPNGSVTIAPKLRMITVQDDEAHLAVVAEAIRQFDVAPRTYRVQLAFYRAAGSLSASQPASAPSQLRGLGDKMKKLLNYGQYSTIDDLIVTGEEGALLEARIGSEYHVSFLLEGETTARGQIRLRNFQVSRVRKDELGRELLQPVFRTTVNLGLEKPLVLGASRDEQSRSALLIALSAQAAGSER